MCLRRILKHRNSSKQDTKIPELEQDIRNLQIEYQLSQLRKYTKFLLIGFFIGKDSDRKVAELFCKIEKRLSENLFEIKSMANQIINSGTYLTYPKKIEFFLKLELVSREVEKVEQSRILPVESTDRIKQQLKVNSQIIEVYNEEFIEQRKNNYKHLWKKGPISLDDQQQTAIVTDDKYNLVVAAAGSGKTEVLTTRIAYLIQRKPDSIEPSRILAIAFQRKASEQIADRLLQRYGIENVNVATFHKLGKGIIERLGRKIYPTDIVNENKKYGFIKSYIEENAATNCEFYRLFIRYMKTVNDKEEVPSGLDKEKAAVYAKEQKYMTINRTKVNSIAEKAIMDYFLTHKINGKPIEVKYEVELETFRPDFYLPQFDVFIEHWALDRNGNVPDWFSQTSEEYRDVKEKKKRWFKEHKRILVETFSYEFNPEEPELFGELLWRRIEKATNKRVELTPLTYGEVIELVWESQKTPIDDIENFITVAKTYGYNPSTIATRLAKNNWSAKQLAFGRFALEVFKAYELQLDRLGKIDFEDMINEATAELERNPDLCRNIYDHILVDEYQDISAQRLNLLKRLLERNPNCKLFCVGDDWQSIMGFSGSNLNFFVKFRDHFENPAVTQICTNYRSIKSIVDTGAELIKNNGDKQVQKQAESKRKDEKPILVFESPHKAGYDHKYFRQTVTDCLDKIDEYLQNGYSAEDIIILTRFMKTKVFGRYRWFKVVEEFDCLAKERGIRVAIDNSKQPNSIRLLTIHKCKGLEARVVFIMNVTSGQFGFPSEIEDSSILDIARGDNGIEDQIEEERRLFYVAITRAKEDLFIYTRQNEESQFLIEIAHHVSPVRLSY